MSSQEPKTVPITVRITEEDKNLLQSLAADSDRSEAAIVRLAIREYAEKHPVGHKRRTA